ncbi:MAG: hypothetical protein LBU94_04205 [Clostridiales bacterium]|jgi:hypothetical protein|nr:hypothetical protein [Clostridiales bacterium]
MSCNYIIRQKDNKISAFYSKNDACIGHRLYENGRWQKEIILVENTLDRFTVSFDNVGGLNVFCQDLQGSILLVNINEGKTNIKIILKNQSDTVHTVLFHSLKNGNGLSLLYNIPTLDKKYRLIRQNLEENGAWGQPTEIDIFNPLPSNLFEVQHVSYEHALVFYRSELNITGYREITPAKTSEFYAIQRQAENILSYSFLTDTDAVHTLYIAPGMFASHLIYRRKEAEAFENPIVLWESPTLENCLLLKTSDTLSVLFHSSGNMYVSKSKDNGLTFSRPEVYRNKICKNPAKARYITYEPMSQLNHACRDVFVDSSNPWDIQILPEICEDFYPYEKSVELPVTENEAPSSHSIDESEYSALANELSVLNEENANNKTEIAKLKKSANDIEVRYTAKLNEKDNIINDFEEENKSLRASLEKLKKELDDIKETREGS